MTTLASPMSTPLELRHKLSLSQEKLSSLLKVSSKTIHRIEKNQSLLKDIDARARLAKLEEIATLGLMVYTEEGLKEFLTTPLAIFDQHTALDMMLIGSYDRVISALAADFEGLGY